VIFLGDAPSLGKAVFGDAAPGFTIYYLSCSNGFTSPTWNGYPTIRIDERACPAAPWLVAHGFAYDTDLHLDHNGDGVSLLMAYALDLNPQLNLGGRLPVPVMDAESMTMSFHAASPGITYRVETSTDLRTWRTDGVTLSGLDADNKRTAAVRRDAPQRFLRLVVE
jgi:hypothetical protein